MLILILIPIWIWFAQQKARQRCSPAGLRLSDLSGRLDQAMAVRRHGSHMMVVMTVIAAALHLIETLREDRGRCQILIRRSPKPGLLHSFGRRLRSFRLQILVQ